ncbi:MAG: hypothetical protein LBL82_05545 [Oscillospiraceae bacterium]|jgi:hypothetical protein|nr:hypothetical protein [Oscillospiraceae bacterium]
MNIVFVSEIQDPYLRGSSTQILTECLLQGLSDLGAKVTFIATYDINNNPENIERYYSKYVHRLCLIRSKVSLTAIPNTKFAKYHQLMRMTKYLLMYRQYNTDIPEIETDEDTILLSHTPSMEAAYICKALMEKHKFKEYVQYWSDPYALVGIYLEDFGVKRYPNYIIESSILKLADRVVYSGKPLFEAQKKLYKKHARKMDCTAFSYSKMSMSSGRKGNLPVKFSYMGDYMSFTRNIAPLFEAFARSERGELLVCGHGNVLPRENAGNITVSGRVSQSEVRERENSSDVLISIINHSCLQIPGKIFYPANTDKILLVILDGKYKREMEEYLGQYNRFVFCENNAESIYRTISEIMDGKYAVDMSKTHLLSPKSIVADILGVQA